MDDASRADARRALARVEADADARALFEAAFTAPGDAVQILRDSTRADAAAHAARDRDLDGLRRTAFGRTTTPTEEATAAAALAAVADAERVHAAQDAALAAAVAAVLASRVETPDVVAPATGDAEGVPAAGVIRDSRWWNRLAAPLGTFLLGAVLAAGVFAFATGSPLAAPEPAASVNPGEDTLVIAGSELLESAHPGDVAAAERWLETQQTESDLVPEGLESIVPSSTHLAVGGVGAWVWVARSVDGDLCVIASTARDGLTASACAPPDSFVLHGAMVSVGGMVGTPTIEAVWDGAKVYVTVGGE